MFSGGCGCFPADALSPEGRPPPLVNPPASWVNQHQIKHEETRARARV